MKILVDEMPSPRHTCLFAQNDRESYSTGVTYIHTKCTLDDCCYCSDWNTKDEIDNHIVCPYLKVIGE